MQEQLGFAPGVEKIEEFFQPGLDQFAPCLGRHEKPILAGKVIAQHHHVRILAHFLQSSLPVGGFDFVHLVQELADELVVSSQVNVEVLVSSRPGRNLCYACGHLGHNHRALVLLGHPAGGFSHSYESVWVRRIRPAEVGNVLLGDVAGQRMVEHIVVHAPILGHAPADPPFVVEVGGVVHVFDLELKS